MNGYQGKNPSDVVAMHMYDPFTYPSGRTPSRFYQKTALVTVKGSFLASTNASGVFHCEIDMYGLDSVNSSINTSDPASSTFDGTNTLTIDNVIPLRTSPVPNLNSDIDLKKVIAAAIRVKYIGREDARSGIFYGYTVQTGVDQTVHGAVVPLDAARNNKGFGSCSVEQGLINCYSPAVEDHWGWANSVFSTHSPTPRIKIVGVGLPASTQCVQIDYAYTLEFMPVEANYDKYELKEAPFGELGSQGALSDVQRCRPLYK